MATNIRPCKGSYALTQFPSGVMFGMYGFHVSASGAIQGHHGPLVMTILSLVVELSYLELVNFTELLLFRDIILQYCMH